MVVNRSLVVLGALLCFSFVAAEGKKAPKKPPATKSGVAQKSGDWLKSSYDPVAIAKKVEANFRHFQNVYVQGILDIKMPVGKTSGSGRVMTQSYVWNPNVFQVQILSYGSIPFGEYVVADWNGQRHRYGGKEVKNEPQLSKMFNFSTDAAFVEKWPMLYPRYLFTPFIGGNASLSRFVKAIFSGVGGYSATLKQRNVTVAGQTHTQYQIFAQRPARGKRPASTVEIIIDGMVWLPVTMNATYGPGWDLRWTGQWYNHWKNMPANPNKLG